MTRSTDQRIKQASLHEEWSVSSVQRLAWAMGRPAAAPAAVRRAAAGMPDPSTTPIPMPGPARRIRLIQALGRLAADATASPAERALAAQRLATLRGTAC